MLIVNTAPDGVSTWCAPTDKEGRGITLEGSRLLDAAGSFVSDVPLDKPGEPEIIVGLANYLIILAGNREERIPLNAALRIRDGVIWHGISPLCYYEDGLWRSCAAPEIAASKLQIG